MKNLSKEGKNLQEFRNENDQLTNHEMYFLRGGNGPVGDGGSPPPPPEDWNP
jgi:hypothetical protein